ncbi:MAG: FKBP-type peptidyl-prolyl cis-trans isomerase [Massilia sp.]
MLLALMSASTLLAQAAEPAVVPAAAPAAAAATVAAPVAVPAKVPFEMLPELTDKVAKVDTVIGTGKVATPGSTVIVNYTGWLYKPLATRQRGRKFDSSLDAGRSPLDFVVGQGQVIKGWDLGVAGMMVGGKRTLLIPSELAYGRAGSPGTIPPNAALVFEVELLEVK